MMIGQRKESWSRQIRGHRNVYRFGGLWARTLLVAVPWVNAVVLVVLLLAVHGQLAITPGVVFDLPRAPLREGARQGLTALMIAVSREAPAGEETLVFFDDDRYSVQDGEQLAMLAERLQNRMALAGSRELLLLADRRVPHGDVIRFVNLAREAGMLRVNVAEKPE